MAALNQARAAALGFSTDKRKRRKQHRRAARNMLSAGGFFNGCGARGTVFHAMAKWHLDQARAI